MARPAPLLLGLLWLYPAIAAGQETPAPLPKVVVVVAGDPDAALREAAAELDARLEADEALLLPGDPGVRRALRGEPAPSADDGLERLRTERRRLGWDEGADAAVLVRIGRMTGAHLVLLLRRDGAIGLEAFDVGARAFYEDRLDLAAASAEEIDAYVRRRAEAAARRAASTPVAARAPPTAAAASPLPAAERAEPGAAAEAAAGEATAAPEEPRARRWFKRNWPYLLAGALLAGTVTAVVVTRRHDSTPPPVLRFVPGGN